MFKKGDIVYYKAHPDKKNQWKLEEDKEYIIREGKLPNSKYIRLEDEVGHWHIEMFIKKDRR